MAGVKTAVLVGYSVIAGVSVASKLINDDTFTPLFCMESIPGDIYTARRKVTVHIEAFWIIFLCVMIFFLHRQYVKLYGLSPDI